MQVALRAVRDQKPSSQSLCAETKPQQAPLRRALAFELRTVFRCTPIRLHSHPLRGALLPQPFRHPLGFLTAYPDVFGDVKLAEEGVSVPDFPPIRGLEHSWSMNMTMRCPFCNYTR